jgi:valyl-tRNA synthetase
MAEAPTKYEMPKAYEPGKVEQKWYKFWLEKGYFTPKIDHKKKPFVIIMPLPNVTGELHMGHVCFLTPEDIMTRWHRMKGESALWLPGIDHAGIAAQVVVEQQLAKERTDRHQMGREKFLERMYQWAEECRKTITKQEQRVGSSCDWSRERFTLEEGPSRAVRTAFVRLYDKGLIYRGERIINWCPRCATALSDLEVDHKDIQGHLYYVKYPLAENDGFITVATTRPETILGDTAVAVNPKDKRFKAMLGKKVILPAVKRIIPIIADEAVDPDFGTGAVKITPAHDPVDFEVAQRQGLPLVNILNPDVTMNENAGPYAGLDRFACRKAILADLEKNGLLVKIEPYTHSVGHCMRCQTIVEPIASKQWFIKMLPLAKSAIEAVTSGRITIIPERFNKVYLNWLENIRDWCISRQLWWGHRIPVWYCQDCGKLTVAVDEARNCSHCGSSHIEQDPDVLDTWFSSALWTHSTLGWPDDTEDLGYFYPTTVMETGYDILFFWVARMIMMGLEDTGDIPFHTVYLHGLLRDEKGEKMSKVRGNVLNPIDTLEKYGTDALRFAISTGTAPGNDIKLSPSKLEAGRNFANKLWNAARFVVRNIEAEQANIEIQWRLLPTEDRWILSRLSRTTSTVNRLMENFQFGEALGQIYDFLWGEFCDWYIEFAKIRLHSEEAPSSIPVLVHVLETSLRLLHPYMPFVTEELWQNLKQCLPSEWQKTESIMVAAYPEAEEKAIDLAAERVMESVIEIIHSIRNARAQYKVGSNRWIEAQVYAGELTPAITPYSRTIQTLARAKPVTFLDSKEEAPRSENVVALVLKESEVIIPMESMVDLEVERKRLQKEIEQSQAEIATLEVRLKDKAFLSKAPAAVVNKERDKLAVRKDKLKRLKQQINKY